MEETQASACVSCKQAIPSGASKCSHCGSFQGRKKWFNEILTYSSLFIALSSLTAIAFSSWKFVSQTRSSEISAQMLNFDGDYLEYVVANNGSSAAVIYQIAVETPYAVGCSTEQPILTQYVPVDSSVVKAGETLSYKKNKPKDFHTYFWGLNAEALAEEKGFGSIEENLDCNLIIGYYDFSDNYEIKRYKFPCFVENECKVWDVEN